MPMRICSLVATANALLPFPFFTYLTLPLVSSSFWLDDLIRILFFSWELVCLISLRSPHDVPLPAAWEDQLASAAVPAASSLNLTMGYPFICFPASVCAQRLLILTAEQARYANSPQLVYPMTPTPPSETGTALLPFSDLFETPHPSLGVDIAGMHFTYASRKDIWCVSTLGLTLASAILRQASA